MNILLKEFLSYIKEEGQPIPADLDKLYHKGYGKYYSDPEFTQYVGRTEKGQWFPASAGQPAQKPVQEPTTQPTTTQQPAQPQSAPVQQTAAERENTLEDPNPKIEAAKAAGVEPARPNDIVQGIFSDSVVVSLGPTEEKTAIRHIIDSENNNAIVDVSTPEGRARAVEILTNRLNELHQSGKIAETCNALTDTSTPTGTRTQLRKWLGTLGELGGLRDMLAAGHPSYLYADSNPKNDIISLINCGDESTDQRNIKLAAISTKTTSGKQVGRIDANALVYIMDSVEGKMVGLRNKDGKRKNFKAENIAQVLFNLQKRVFSQTTRDDITGGGKDGRQRIIKVAADKRHLYDPNLLKQAEAESLRGNSKEGGGQRTLMEARRLTPEEVHSMLYEPTNPEYQKLRSDMTKIMGGEGGPNDPSGAASLLIGIIGDSLLKQVESNRKFTLNTFNEWMTKQIAELIDYPDERTNKGSELVFQSDMMIATFDAEKGYVGCGMVSGEMMTQRVNAKFGEEAIQKMSTAGKLKTILGWKCNPRGILSKLGFGRVDPQQRAVPPLKYLKKGDYKDISKYAEEICKRTV